jgi:hypothetical protein
MPSGIASKTYGTVAADRRKEMSGLQFVRGLVEGSLPLNTIARTLGYEVTEVSDGRVVVTAKPGEAHLNPAGMAGSRPRCWIAAWGSPSGQPWRRASARRRLSSRFHRCGRSRLRPG